MAVAGITVPNIPTAPRLSKVMGVAVLGGVESAALVSVSSFSDDVLSSPGLETRLQAAAAGTVRKASWPELAAVAGTRDGQPGEVTNDSGSHTDPVVGGAVADKGIYSWSAGFSGWRRVGDLIDPAAIEEAANSASLTRNFARSFSTKQISLFNPLYSSQDTALNGTDGTTSSSAGIAVSDYLPVTTGERVFWGADVYSMAYFDSNKVFVSGAVGSSSPARARNDVEFPPAGAAYVRFHYPMVIATQYQVVSGGSALPAGTFFGGPYPRSNTPFNQWAGKSLAFLGDSYTEINQYPLLMAEYLDMVRFSYAGDGAGGTTMLQRATYLTDAVADTIDADAISILFGTNDWGLSVPIGNLSSPIDSTTYVGAARSIHRRLQTRQPGITVMFLTPTWWQGAYGAVNGNGDSLRDFADALIEACEFDGIPYVDTHRNVPFNTRTFNTYFNLGTDTIHPNPLGFSVIARQAAAGLLRL